MTRATHGEVFGIPEVFIIVGHVRIKREVTGKRRGGEKQRTGYIAV